MPKPEEIKIQAKNIDAAAGEIIGVLEDTSKGNVIFVSGWYGFGASASLKAVAQHLKSSKSKFDRVIHVDCSLWKSMRALQKAVAEELELPPSVMAIFDWCDEEDDFSGIDKGSRGVIADIRTEIYRRLANSRFVVIFHNGSDEYIDVYQCGVPVISILSNKVLWTWHGRFGPGLGRYKRKQEDMEMHTDVFINYCHDSIGEEAILEEAKEVVTYMGIPEPYMNHLIVEKCFLYAYALGSFSFHRGLRCWDDVGNCGNHASSYLCRLPDRWVVVVYNRGKLPDEIGMVLSEATSFFVVQYSGRRHVWHAALPDGIFQHPHSSKLRVLHLSECEFSFESPPFICCSQLRFLVLSKCANISSDKHPGHNEDMSCFQKLWVLHLNDTLWCRLLSEEMMTFMADLRELYVAFSFDERFYRWSISDLRGMGPSLIKFHVKSYAPYSNVSRAIFPDLSCASFLKTIIFENCAGLEQVVPGMLSPLLESFTFKYNEYDSADISSISFRGFSQLKSILLEGYLDRLEELDLSGTRVKTLDLRKVKARNLIRLILLGCEKLCAILWPPEDKRTKVLEVLQINTIGSTSPGQANWEEKLRNPIAAMGSSSILAATATEQGINRYASFDFKWLIYVLPLSETADTLPHLDTLEIVCCGDLREVFPLDPKQKRQRIIECPKLRRIHLYELPSLQHICGSRMSAPNLETVKIRGCWSLRGLPAVSRNNEKLPSVDCEKDWWDNLEWDGVEADHHPSLYVHRHSSYYKAQQPRGTVLR
ncbi:hypothetical protein ZWY2020_015597 [Hordeum vulgare]|nr:hypothetical protein ZWY2020_015597 [Hordeum vulgare]